MQRGEAGTNWAGNIDYSASAVVEPSSMDELRSLVTATPRVRALGTRHSFSRVADGDGILLSLAGLDAAPELGDGTVTVGSATPYGVLAAWLEERGMALHNMGSLPHISIGGAIATGTHGSGDALGALATAVRGLEVVGPDGELLSIRAGDPDFEGSIVALGALGIVTRVTLAVQPTYLVRQDAYAGLSWAAAIEHFDDVMSAGYSVSMLSSLAGPNVENVWVKSLAADAPDELVDARRVGTEWVPGPNMTDFGAVGPWSDRLPHFRLDSTPSNGHELQAEYFVSRADAAEALIAVRSLAARITPIVHAMELRTVAADELWLSPMYRRDSLAIAFTWKYLPAEVAALLPDLERALEPFDPRPHWGKLYSPSLPTRLPLSDAFAELRDRVDPGAKFGNEMVRGLFGGA
jgi:xylitol oxidase